MPMNRRFKRITIGLVALCVLAFGVIAYSFLQIRSTIHNSYAVWWVADMVVEHMEANSGEWPANWSDLRDDYETCVSRSGRPWRFEELRSRVEVDWSADPQSLLADSAGSDTASFRVIWLRDGTESHWAHAEPNQIILEYLRSRTTADHETPSDNSQSGIPASDDGDSLRPSATRTGTTIILAPSGASFSIPADWVEWHDQFRNNFHLTHEQLDAVEHVQGEWDTEYAGICNAIFPFDRCCAHVGREGWGRDSVSFADLQLRVYELPDDVAAIRARIENEGSREVEAITGAPVDLQHDETGLWTRSVFTYDRFYIDYGATAHVEIRVRRFEDRTIAFVFMYTDYQSQADLIESILDSFRWQAT